MRNRKIILLNNCYTSYRYEKPKQISDDFGGVMMEKVPKMMILVSFED